MKHNIIVKSLNCGNTADTIRKSLSKVEGVTSIDFALEENMISIEGSSVTREVITGVMNSLQYQEKEQQGIFSRKNTYDNWYCYYCSGCDA
ncbi:MAG: heavy metal-associated domain-containing protein [Ginsengibacter sp.]